MNDFIEDGKDLKKFKNIIESFYDMKGNNFTKTDLKARQIKPLAKLHQFAQNATPMMNKHASNEEAKIDVEYIDNFIGNYIEMLVSKDRKGREEFTEMSKSPSKEKDQEEMVEQLMDEISD